MWLVEPLEKRSVSETTTWTKEIDGEIRTIVDTIGYRWGRIYYNTKPEVDPNSPDGFNIYDIGEVDYHDYDGEAWFTDTQGLDALPEEEKELLEENNYDFQEAGWYDAELEINCCGPVKITEV